MRFSDLVVKLRKFVAEHGRGNSCEEVVYSDLIAIGERRLLRGCRCAGWLVI